METVERPLTAEERAILARPPGWPPSRRTGIAGGVTIGLVGSLVLLLALSFAPNGSSVAPTGAVLGGAAASFGWYLRRQLAERRAWSRALEKRAAALQGGLARVTRYHARDAIVVEEFEDEGPGYYLELTDGRVLYLGGQYLYEPAEQRRFPATEFEISRVAATGDFLALTLSGSYLSPSSSRPHFSAADYETGRVPENEAVLDGPFESFRS